jgi:hypothetical protein
VILPSKYQNLELCELNITTFVLRKYSSRGVIRFEDLFDTIIGKFGEESKPMVMPSLSILFMLGKITYNPKTDKIRFINSEA